MILPSSPRRASHRTWIVLGGLCLVCGAAGSLPSTAPTTAHAQAPTATPRPLPDPGLPGEPPAPHLRLGQHSRPMAVGTFCWRGGCVDVLGPITPAVPMLARMPATATLEFASTEALRSMRMDAHPVSMDMASELTAGPWKGRLLWDPARLPFSSASIVHLRPTHSQEIALPLHAGLNLLWLMVDWQSSGDAAFGILVDARLDVASRLHLPWLTGLAPNRGG